MAKAIWFQIVTIEIMFEVTASAFVESDRDSPIPNRANICIVKS